VVDVLRAAQFDFIVIETVGVGQSEVEIASMAETTVVVLVPESGDEVQALKSGIMEIADIVVVNKSDREGADKMVKGINSSLHDRKSDKWEVPVLKTVASKKEGTSALLETIRKHSSNRSTQDKLRLLINQASRILVNRCMAKINRSDIETLVKDDYESPGFNLYKSLKNVQL